MSTRRIRAAASSIAAGNGIHVHDDELEDFRPATRSRRRSRRSNAAHVLSTKIDSTSLTLDERVDRRILLGIIDGWLLEQETLENWRRNPCSTLPRLPTDS
jgi:hypothetical protein